MASKNNLPAAILVLSLLLFSTITTACGTCKPTPTPKPKPTPPPPPKTAKCPKDTLKLGACVDLLGLVSVNIGAGSPSSSKCCAVLDGLVDLEAALCLCTAIKANVLGINLDIPVALSLLLSACGKTVPPGYQC